MNKTKVEWNFEVEMLIVWRFLKYVTDILIEKEYTEKGELELSVQIISQDSYYLIMGVVGEEEFKKIIENVYIREAN